jgi:para-nitrobenzyl esterase
MVAVALGVSQPALSQIRAAKVTGGELEGVVKDGVASFKGIPFAAPPLGELRWKAPQPVKRWTGVKKADRFGPGCMQDISTAAKMGMPTEISEDCLYLNVWTAANGRAERSPVMVWIYGGAFAGGMTSAPLYDGARLAKKGVVLVSVAYRVGPFGFLAHEELSKESGKGSGTYGLQDQIAGLRWVKDNIAQFGGDPSRVTIFGESAGGISVSMLAASPAARGLLHRAISQSGGSFAPPKLANEAGENVLTLRMAEVMGVSLLNRFGVEDIKSARKVAADQILKAAGGMGLFWPVADGDVLPGDQYELYQAGKFNDTPILIGTNSDEGRCSSAPASRRQPSSGRSARDTARLRTRSWRRTRMARTGKRSSRARISSANPRSPGTRGPGPRCKPGRAKGRRSSTTSITARRSLPTAQATVPRLPTSSATSAGLVVHPPRKMSRSPT